MIIGIGIDLVEAKRIQKLLDEYADRFAARVLNSEEREHYERSSRPMWFLHGGGRRRSNGSCRIRVDGRVAGVLP